MRNPKKQVVDEKLKSMACYLMKSDDSATNKQRRGSWGTTRDWQLCLGLGFWHLDNNHDGIE